MSAEPTDMDVSGDGHGVATGGVAPTEVANPAANDETAAPLEELLHHVRGAYVFAEDAELRHRQDSALLQDRVACTRRENEALAARIVSLEEAAGPEGEGARLVARAEAADAARDDLDAALAGARAEAAEARAALTRAADASAADAASLSDAFARAADAAAAKIRADERAVAAEDQLGELAREAEDRTAEDGQRVRRLQFLEEDRVGMSADLAEARSQLDMRTAAHAKEAEQLSGRITDLAGQLESAQQRAQLGDERCSIALRQIGDLQADRERVRLDTQREIESMNNQLDIYRENEQDAEKRFNELKQVIAGMSATMKAKDARAIESGGLGAHADALLKHVQAELDTRMDDIETQSKQVEEARAAERKMSIALEKLRREQETLMFAVEHAEKRARTAEEGRHEALRRNDQLERRIMLVGAKAAAASHPMMLDNTDAAAHRVQQPSLLGGNQLLLPGLDTQSTPRLDVPMTPSKYTLDVTLQEVSSLRQQHDALVANIVQQRDMYRNLVEGPSPS